MTTNQKIQVTSEVGILKRLLIHSPDSGIGKVIPNKAQDWLYDDIVDLQQMREEYDYYVQILLYFLDPEKIKDLHAQRAAQTDKTERLDFFNPNKATYFKSDKVIEVQYILAKVLADPEVRLKLVASVCGVEKCSHYDLETLLELSNIELSKTLISGYMNEEDRYVFAPLPNLIFTRDIGVTVGNHLLLTRPARQARYRESLITKYIAYYYLFGGDRIQWKKVVELTEDEDFFMLEEEQLKNEIVTIEGGDVMMISPRHLMVGCSERTSPGAINQVIHTLFKKEILDKITVVKIPIKRDYMHIDTLFTMVKRNMWVLFGPLSKKGKTELDERYNFIKDLIADPVEVEGDKIEILQYDRFQADYRAVYNTENPKPKFLEDLFTQICRLDFGCDAPMQFVYSGGGDFPYDEREQWTDSCNLLALKEGVVIGYSRNQRTAKAFEAQGFEVISAEDLVVQFDSGERKPDDIENTLILLPSAELSRARGGSHCMSMPLFREEI